MKKVFKDKSDQNFYFRILFDSRICLLWRIQGFEYSALMLTTRSSWWSNNHLFCIFSFLYVPLPLNVVLEGTAWNWLADGLLSSHINSG